MLPIRYTFVRILYACLYVSVKTFKIVYVNGMNIKDHNRISQIQAGVNAEKYVPDSVLSIKNIN